MYLISIYFDEKTNDRINQLIQKVAVKTGNTFMVDGHVPPHITLSAFQAKSEKEVIEKLETYIKHFKQGKLQWVSVGAFLPHVIYITPVLNEYLQSMVEEIHGVLSEMEGVIVQKCYQPFNWLPHSTIAKTLTKEQLQEAFAVLQKQFAPFVGNVIKIGLAKTNPYEDLAVFEITG